MVGSQVGVNVPGRVLDLDRDEIELTVPDSSLGRDSIGKATDVA